MKQKAIRYVWNVVKDQEEQNENCYKSNIENNNFDKAKNELDVVTHYEKYWL